MPKYLVETISSFRHRYVIECENGIHAIDTVTCEEAEEMSQHHIGETIFSNREIDDAEYIRIFNEDNDYLREWTDEQKFKFIHRVNYE